MTTSINQPWSIGDKVRNRFGNLWADLDFVMQSKISEENFKTDPMNVTMGELHIAGQCITMRYKDLIAYSKSVETLCNNIYSNPTGKDEKFEVTVKGRNFLLTKQEVRKLTETLNDALNASMRGYELGLYL
jgi:hypothetical protein